MSYLYIDYTYLLEVSRMREIVSGILDTNCDAVVRWQKYNNLLVYIAESHYVVSIKQNVIVENF